MRNPPQIRIFMTASKRLIIIAAAVLWLAGCTSVQVEPLLSAPPQLCIEENPKVQVDDFVTVMQESFTKHGIQATLQSAPTLADCPYIVTYTALRSWDFVTYLSFAELSVLDPQRRSVASAHYHLRGKGGMSFMKWSGTRSKMEPVLEQMLSQVKVEALAPSPLVPVISTNGLSKDEQVHNLQQEKLSYEQYTSRYKQIMAQ
jgi:hypothetical protein